MVTIEVKTKKFKDTLKHVKAAVNGRSKRAMTTSCEITITDGNMTIAVPGCQYNLSCKTEGVAKVTTPFLYFYDIIKNHRELNTIMKIYKDEINIGLLTFAAKTNFIENDRILRTIDLPLNYNDLYLLKLPHEGYTIEELDFNRMTPMIKEAHERLDKNLEKAYKYLSVYGVSFEQLKKIIVKEMGKKFKSQ